MEEPKVYKPYELTLGDACEKKRAFGGILKDKESIRYKEATLLQTALKLALSGKGKDIEKYLQEGYKTIPFRNEIQRQIRISDGIRQIERYVSSEKRTPLYYRSLTVELGCKTPVYVTPTFSFYNEEEKEFEAVKIKNSKPFIRQKKAYESLELYALLKWARATAKTLESEVKSIRASIYYLRRNDDSDSVEKPVFEADFFKKTGGGNIISTAEAVETSGETTAGPGKRILMTPEQTDAAFAAAVSLFEDGIPETECSDLDCSRCTIHDECKYSLPPKPLVKEKVTRHLSDLSLTTEQQEAVEYEEGICRINAGAGSGKTTVVALRVVTLIEKGYDPKKMLLITFTNSGAKEMKERINLYCEDFGLETNADEMTVTTFNSFGYEIVKKEYEKLGYPSVPYVIDDVERSRIIAELLNNGEQIPGLDYRNFSSDSLRCVGALATAKKVFDVMKAKRLSIGDVEEIRKCIPGGQFYPKTTVEKLAEKYFEYDSILRSRSLIEYSDQEGLLWELLYSDPFYMEQFGFEHIIVDEFQDTSEGQINFLKVLRGAPSFKSLMVVGDDSQAIFGFRDTSPEFIIDFPKYMGEEVDDIFLLENHRSTPEILDFANRINALNSRRVAKDLKATRPHGKPVTVKGFYEKAEERNWVAGEIASQLAAGHKPEDLCIICSTKAELLEMADLLQRKGVPTVLLNPEPLKDNSRVKAAISMVYVLEDPEDEKDLLAYANALEGGIILSLSEEDRTKIVKSARKKISDLGHLPETEKKDKLLEMFRELDMDDEVYESFIDSMSHKSFEKIIEWCDDFYEYGSTTAFRRLNDYPGVALTTAHSSKGLEWPVVYDMISKYHTGKMSFNEIEEKRRLLFVTATRARDELYVTAQYDAYGKRGQYTYNQFLIESINASGDKFSSTAVETERELRRVEKKAQKERNKNVQTLDAVPEAKIQAPPSERQKLRLNALRWHHSRCRLKHLSHHMRSRHLKSSVRASFHLV